MQIYYLIAVLLLVHICIYNNINAVKNNTLIYSSLKLFLLSKIKELFWRIKNVSFWILLYKLVRTLDFL